MSSAAARRVRQQLMPWLITLVLLVLWEVLTRASGISNVVLPPPSEILQAMVRYHQIIAQHALQTLITTVVGFALALAAGIFIGLAIGAWAEVYRGVYPLLVAFNAIPKVALMPLFVLWCGIGAIPAVLTAFTLALFPIVVNVATGIATIEPEMEDVMRSLGARRDEILVKVGIPRAMPYLFASLKVAITLAFVGSVISETVASNEGIGFLLMGAAARFEVSLVFAGLVVVAIMAVIAYAICEYVETRMAHWAFRARTG
jgi:NitT/TauT family transport system permease protein